MQKKTILIIVLLVILAGIFVYPRVIAKSSGVIGVSELTANPSKYLGKLTVRGSVGEVYRDEGAFIMVDGGGCCVLPLMVPFTAEQKEQLQADSIYRGALPAKGDMLEVSGTLKTKQGYIHFDVDKVSRGGQVIISKAR